MRVSFRWQLSIKLKAKLEQRAKDGEKAFEDFAMKHAVELCEAPGGTELVQMVGYVYCQEGKQYAGRFLGLEGFFAQIQEKAHVVSSGAAVIADAVKTANMANEVGDRQRGGSSEVMRTVRPRPSPPMCLLVCRISPAPSPLVPIASLCSLCHFAVTSTSSGERRTQSLGVGTLATAATPFDGLPRPCRPRK